MTAQDQLRLIAAREAIKYVVEHAPIGVGTGLTVNLFIEELAKIKQRIVGAVASSQRTAVRLREHGIPILDLNEVNELPVYVDGADEVTEDLTMIKGGGGALTREKIIAAAAKTFICIADESKLVPVLGKFPLPIEVVPMARSYVAGRAAKLGGRPSLRENYVTENGNVIIDVAGLDLSDPRKTEAVINSIAGVVTVGLFVARGADVLLLGTTAGVRTLTRGAGQEPQRPFPR